MFLCCFWPFHSIQQRNRREFLATAPETVVLKGENDTKTTKTTADKWLCSLGLRSGGAESHNASARRDYFGKARQTCLLFV